MNEASVDGDALSTDVSEQALGGVPRHTTYSNLVEGENDLIGLIAYSLYKGDKMAYIRQYVREEGKSPSETEMLAFCRTLALPGQISSLRNKAAVLLEEMNEEVLKVTISELQDQFRDQLLEELKKPRSFWRSVGENLVANVLAAALTVLVVVLVYGAQIGYVKLFGDVFGYEVKAKSP